MRIYWQQFLDAESWLFKQTAPEEAGTAAEQDGPQSGKKSKEHEGAMEEQTVAQ